MHPTLRVNASAGDAVSARTSASQLSVSVILRVSSLVHYSKVLSIVYFTMARNGVTALSLAVLLALLEIGSCIKCYQCNSQSDPKCKDPFTPNDSILVDCNSQDSMNFNRAYLAQVLPGELIHALIGAPRSCHKIIMESGTTIRTCLDVNPTSQSTCDTLKTSQDMAKRSKFCSVCYKDGCNGAGSISVSLPLAFAAAIASYLYSKQ